MVDVDMDPTSSTAAHKRGKKTAGKSAESSAIDQFTELLDNLELNPNSVPLIRQQIALLKQLGLSKEEQDATSRLSDLIMLDEAIWIAYLDTFTSSLPSPLPLVSFLDTIEKYNKAEDDYLSFNILQSHQSFILRCVSPGAEATDQLPLDDDLTAFLEKETVRGRLKDIVTRADGLLSQSHLLWQRYLDWELSVAKFPDDLPLLHRAFVDRLTTPHLALDETSASYSSFCSEHAPNSYETHMVEATNASQSAKFKLFGEKRFGKTRSDIEQLLTVNPLATYSTYIDWETDPRAKNPKNARSPSSDPGLTSAVFERALASYTEAVGAIERSASGMDAAASVQAYKTAEAGIWRRYIAWTEDLDAKETVVRRACRACPQIGAIWAQQIHLTELASPGDTGLVVEQALALGLLDSPKDVADVFATQAAVEIRRGSDQVLSILQRGMDIIHSAHKSGDPNLQLETFLLEWAESKSAENIDEALALVERPNKSRGSSHRLVLQRSGIEQRRGNVDAARKILQTAAQRSDLDWPEAVYEALLRFENIHGTIETLLAAQRAVDAELLKLTRRREKEAQKQMEQYANYAATDPTVAPAAVDATESGTSGNVEPVQAEDAHFKRFVDLRWLNTTILVTGLPESTEGSELEAYFENCGNVRECTLIPGTNSSAASALVEFRFADAVPAALAMDRKKYQGHELAISMLWRSTLFVTNFPRDVDDDRIRGLFSQYGTILQSRWPSRKYADARRFCYITMASPAAAQEALVLHGMKLGDFGLTVLVSDPAAKTRRTDASSVNSTLFVGGLTPKTTEKDVENIVRPYGTVRGVKLGWDPIKSVCKGFAFVEMSSEAEAKAATVLTGTQRNGKYLKVEMNDPNHAVKKHDTGSSAGAMQAAERRSRTVRLHGLPESTQEGLLQQALEKLVPVRRLEVFASSHEAIAELDNAADVGKLLLQTQTEPFRFEDAEVAITQQERRPHVRRDEAPSNPKASLKFAPRAARKGQAIGKAPKLPKPITQPEQRNGAEAQGQDSFRNFVQSTNAQRGDKRGAEDVADGESSKRTKRD